jgi:pyruvate formate lyase activating enzyme
MKKEAMIYQQLEDNFVHCHLCAHHCKIAPAKFGFCGVRQNVEGRLYTLAFGQVIAQNIDPIEKKPLYHFLPGSRSYSVATIGCNFRCGFCQNWQISQASQIAGIKHFGRDMAPEAIVEDALKNNCASIAFTYTEPTIFFEYAYETAKSAKLSGIQNVFVTNGYMTRKAIDIIAPYLDAANVDLKAWNEAYYAKHCKAHVKPVLDSIRYMKKLGIWLEITTLIIPGENDSDSELQGIAEFIADTGPEIPWHISRFHPDYQFETHAVTPLKTLEKAKNIGESMGLRFVYTGNVPIDNNTYCDHCKTLLVHRRPFAAKMNIRGQDCPSCGTKIHGVWN